MFLSAPDREGLREALELPTAQVGHRFESAAMVDDMLDNLAGTPGALPLLQFAASKLWDARDRERRLLTMTSYLAIGGISGALATHADDIVRTMQPSAQKLTRTVFRALVTPEHTRAIVELADLYQLAGDRDAITRVVDQLVAARLLVVQTRADAGGGSVEIVHESLIDRWPTLRRWLDEDQEDAGFLAQLGVAAKQWDAKGRRSGLLWRGEAMEEARRWSTTRPRPLGMREQAFLDAVLALARRGKRARGIVLASAFVVLGGIAAVASVAYLRLSALKQEASASAQTATAKEAEARKALADYTAEQAKSSAALSAAEIAQRREEAARLAAQQTGQQLELSKDDLQKANAALERKVAEAEAASRQAEAASRQAVAATKKAEAAAADAQRAKANLQTKLDAEKARSDQLRQDLSKLSTKLK